MRIGVLVIATAKYVSYVKQLWESLTLNFLAGNKHDVTVFVHADGDLPALIESPWRHVRRIEQPHLGWPFATLYRYRTFLRSQAELMAMDYLYYLDVDMTVVGPVGEEIFGDLVATLHPGFWRPAHDTFPHEARSASRAFVPEALRKTYYCGGFQGGSGHGYMGACRTIAAAIEDDLDHGIIAKWHDESHWNRYLLDHGPALVLGPEYCVPEEFAHFWKPGPRILALKKDHAAMRS